MYDIVTWYDVTIQIMRYMIKIIYNRNIEKILK